MKKLTTTQWVTLVLTIASFTVSKLENLGVAAEIVLAITEILGIAKFAYDTYVSYTEKEVVSFGNYLLGDQRNYSVSHVNKTNVTDADLRNWKSNKN